MKKYPTVSPTQKYYYRLRKSKNYCILNSKILEFVGDIDIILNDSQSLFHWTLRIWNLSE